MDLFGNPDIKEPETDIDLSGDDGDDDNAAFSHPKYTDILLGHEKTERHLLNLLNAGRMPHAIILHGQKGIGKATLAYRLAKFLLSQQTSAETLNSDRQSGYVRRILSGGHADFLAIERAFDTTKNKYKESVAVEDVRRVPNFLRKTAADGGWRVVIVDDADTMTRSSQNAILKILEEPPAQTILILVVHNIGALVPTILSRSHVLPMLPLEQSAMIELLKLYDPMMGLEDKKITLSMAKGSFGNALRFIQDGGLDVSTSLHEIVAHCPNWKWSSIHVLANEITQNGNEAAYQNFIDIMTQTLQNITRTIAREQKATEGHAAPLYDALSNELSEPLMKYYASVPLENLLEICENLDDIFTKTYRSNLDKKQAVLSCFSALLY